MKRTPLRRVSKKQAATNRRMKQPRADFAAEYSYCPVCSKVGKKLTVHEIARGSHRQKGLVNREAWLPACAECNSGSLHSHTEWPIAQQLALKILVDPEFYDRVKVNELRGRQADDVTEKDVVMSLMDLLRAGYGPNW